MPAGVHGTVIGLGLGWPAFTNCARWLRQTCPSDEVRIDGTVLAYTALAGLVAAAIFGIVPAWRASQPTLMNVLRGTAAPPAWPAARDCAPGGDGRGGAFVVLLIGSG